MDMTGDCNKEDGEWNGDWVGVMEEWWSGGVVKSLEW
jgi:hypothetical protein